MVELVGNEETDGPGSQLAVQAGEIVPVAGYLVRDVVEATRAAPPSGSAYDCRRNRAAPHDAARHIARVSPRGW